MKTDVIDQVLVIALHPAYDCDIAKVSVELILNLTQSPETHAYIIRREVVETLLEICEKRHKMVDLQSSQSRQKKKEDPVMVNVLRYVLSHSHSHA